jgi:glyoxylase-like metal-dependent hydrolase (beta-lactamase superfamily II)
MSEAPRTGFVEVGERCYAARYRSFDVNVGVVLGARGAVVVDTRASEVEAAELLDDLRALGVSSVLAVVNTHWHFDHTFGNALLRDEYGGVAFYAQEAAAATLREAAGEVQRTARDDVSTPGHADIAAARIHVPDHTFSSVAAIDLGDRVVEVVHPGRGHTSGDAVVRVPDADVAFLGDLVEESAERDATPGFGVDCWPLEWASSLELTIGMLTSGSVVVPGHGAPVDRAFVDSQRADISDVAERIRALAGAGVPAADALAAGAEMTRPAPLAQRYSPGGQGGASETLRGWPFDPKYLTEAVARGYAHLR